MPMDLTGIQNVGEFYSHHYLDALMSTADGGNTRWERHGNVRHVVYSLICGTLAGRVPRIGKCTMKQN